LLKITTEVERLKRQGYRYGGLCSKGGALMVQWMMKNNRENPLYEQFDRVCGILKKYDTVLSLGNGIRAGAIGRTNIKISSSLRMQRP
jgi:phosphomethylpyrimidine synthase